MAPSVYDEKNGLSDPSFSACASLLRAQVMKYTDKLDDYDLLDL